VILERRKTKELSRLALARFANRAQRAAGVAGAVNILLTGDAEMQRLNLQFRGKPHPTDVLSFPHAPAAGSATLRGKVPDLASGGGEIAISLPAARAQAARLGHSLLTELKVLVLHGMLHLAGYDHERDRGQMRRIEQRLRAQLRLPSGLIERTIGQSIGQDIGHTMERNLGRKIGRKIERTPDGRQLWR
jgi:probable rRNA maturation factor